VPLFGFSSLGELALATVLVTVGSAAQGSVGFGLALLTAPILVWIDPRLVPAPLTLAVTVLLALTAHRERHAIDVRGVGWILLGRLPGTWLGATALVGLTTRALTVGLGLLVLLGVGISLLSVRPPRKPVLLSAAGVVSGVMGTTAALGGPAIAILYQHERGELVRSTLAAVFLIGAGMSLTALVLIGRLGLAEVELAAGLLPGILLGFFLSRGTGAWLDRGRTRNAVLLLSALSGAVSVVRGLS
jgi:uncharacterized membrane protein YfcA